MPLTKLRILTDRMTGAERRFSLRTLVALSSLPLFGVVAAFGLAPDTNTLAITPQTITEAIALPALATENTDGTFARESMIQSGDTLTSALSRLKIDDLEIQRLLGTDAVRELASSIHAGKRIQATTTQDGQLLTIQFERSDAPALTVRRQGDSFVAEESSELIETRVVMRSGTFCRRCTAPPTAPVSPTRLPTRWQKPSRPAWISAKTCVVATRSLSFTRSTTAMANPLPPGNCWRPNLSMPANHTAPSCSATPLVTKAITRPKVSR